MKVWQTVVVFGVVATSAACGKSTPPASSETTAPATQAPETKPPETNPTDTNPTDTKPPDTKPAEVDAGATPPTADAAAPAPDGCVTRDLFQPLGRISPDHAALSGNSLTLCGQTDDPSGWCFSVDFATGKLDGAKQADDDIVHVPNYLGAINDPFRRADDKPILQLCLDAATGCKDVYVGNATAATLSHDNKRVVVTTLDDRERRLRTVDTSNYSEIGNLELEKDADLPDCSFGVAAGDQLIISTGPCAAGAPRKAWIAKANGEKVADVGAVADFDLRFNGFVHLNDALWAFRDNSGSKIVIQDVSTGTVQATADLSAAGPPAKGATWLFASESTPDAPARIVAVENRPQNGSVYLIDPGTGTISKRFIPAACP